jgi:hypothetical protein
MYLQMLTIERMSCFALGFILLDITQYPQTPFVITKVSLIGYHIIPSSPSCTLWPCRYHHTSTAHPTRQLTRAPLISQQAITYQTHGVTCYSGVSTPKIRSLAYSSMTNHITGRILTVSTILTHAQTTASILTRSTHILTNGRPTLLILA